MLIGFLGEANSGKDTAGQFLVQDHKLYSMAFADHLKVFLMWVFNWSPERLWGPSEHRNQEDHEYPFIRCPSCGVHLPDLSEELAMAMAEKWDSYACPVCHGQRAPKEWLANLSPRYALQSLGSDWARNLNKHGHVKFTIRRAMAAKSQGLIHAPLWPVLPAFVKYARWTGLEQEIPRGVYISDVRFRNEVQWIQEVGGMVYRIVRSSREDNTTTGVPNHASEVEQREIEDRELDGVIDNNGTLEDLKEKVSALL